jgi:hypothetical protein
VQLQDTLMRAATTQALWSRLVRPRSSRVGGPTRLVATLARGRKRATRRTGSVRVLVGGLDAVLMHVWMGVDFAAVLVLMFMLDVNVIVGRVGMDVAVAVMLMLVRMRRGVRVLIGHGAPLVAGVDEGGRNCGVGVAWSWRCSRWRNASSRRTATCGSCSA